ncbi:MAG: hypothetical protein ABJO01_06575 [Parasphingorhabdus sp.]|uniref:hypothetical protein n=1 Tax=Parasphingorhabdus sp. TaxID=2709688 RepID=UPI00329890F8
MNFIGAAFFQLVSAAHSTYTISIETKSGAVMVNKLAKIIIVALFSGSAAHASDTSSNEESNPFHDPFKDADIDQTEACKTGPVSAFGRYVGKWSFQDSTLSSDGESWDLGKGGLWDFYCLGNGISVQDFWMPKAGGFGTTLRMYDPKKKSWDVVFAGEGSQAMSRLIANQLDDGSIEMHYVTPEFKPYRRIRFSVPTATGFDWELAISSDEKKTWKTVYKMRATPR